MKPIDFDNQKDRDKALTDLKGLLDSAGWILLVYIAKENMDVIKEQILDGIGDQDTMENINRLRDRLKAYKDIIGTPERMIEKLKPVEKSTHNEDDPYL